ncbi:hypothetical protein GL50803_004188 [Giardia duodenalis]|uniref:Uncharacterized protein n=1 Tax=Giardia intestinalis (strain ATCC 50803 / WB clone C6) TaxID=184922 RepID=A8BQH2_GIAIC|nr:hypothetical protein GL50803_004188 [Giardia intestinalis]KAE8302012.1 hypothetical protein GL50803_004188 [Giardia intestinalis]|eukprot:XP_001705523.1 Hypothetical protein GL50803_4188 [Giardia lamblia ATCC 50803]
MPQHLECTLEQKQILQGLAANVVRVRGGAFTVEELLANPVLLHEQVSSIRVSWDAIVKHLNISRNSAYHWYHETYVRHITGTKVTPVDKAIIRNTILRGIEDRSILLDEFRSKLKASLSRNYHRAEFTMTYNNLLRSRCVQTAMANAGITLPSRRSTRPNQNSAQKTAQKGVVPVLPDKADFTAQLNAPFSAQPAQPVYKPPPPLYMEAPDRILSTPVFAPIQNNFITNLPFISTAPVMSFSYPKNAHTEGVTSTAPLTNNPISYELLSIPPPCLPQWGTPFSIQQIPSSSILPAK